jgi:opacity protein-like surface antigen
MKMQKLIILAVLMIGCTPPASAQSDEHDVEIFAGFSAIASQSRITNNDIITFAGVTPAQIKAQFGSELVGNDRFIAAYGFEASATRYFSKRVGLTGEFSGYYHRETTGIAGELFRANHSIYSLLGGPHLRFTNKTRLTPFVHALVGAARVRTGYREVASPDHVAATDSSTRLAMAFGGGLDLRLSKRVALRLFQLDYSPILGSERRLIDNEGTVVELNGRAQSKNFRLSIGVVFK